MSGDQMAWALALLGRRDSAEPTRSGRCQSNDGEYDSSADDPGWDNVAVIRGSTGIYLGNLWVMTADHVGVGSVNFPEKGLFSADSDSLVRLKNPRRSGLSNDTDIILFQLTEDPGLPPLLISQISPPVGTEAIVVGYGKDRMDEVTHWNSRWEETDPPSRYSGFQPKVQLIAMGHESD